MELKIGETPEAIVVAIGNSTKMGLFHGGPLAYIVGRGVIPSKCVTVGDLLIANRGH